MITYTDWEKVPEYLHTKTSLAKQGLRPARGQQRVAIKRSAYRGKIKYYSLFDISQAVKKRKASDKQKSALAKARKKSVENRTCQGCGYVQPLGKSRRNTLLVRDGYCQVCQKEIEQHNHYLQTIEWAKQLLDVQNAVILDTETTGVHKGAEIVQLGVINMKGEVLFDSLIKPVNDPLTPESTEIHGITQEMLADAPSFADIWPELEVILQDKPIVAYNAEFDRGMLYRATGERVGLLWECAMSTYATYLNDWSDYHDGYRWVSLANACEIEGISVDEPAHTAIGDCLRTLELIKAMANGDGRIDGVPHE